MTREFCVETRVTALATNAIPAALAHMVFVAKVRLLHCFTAG